MMSGESKSKKARTAFIRSELSEPDSIRLIKSSWEEGTDNRSDLNKIKVNVVQCPFKVCVVSDFFEDTEILKSAIAELENVDFFPKNNDLYRFSQTDDLQNLTDFTHITKLYEIFCTEVHSWLGKVHTKETLKNEISATFSSYQFGGWYYLIIAYFK